MSVGECHGWVSARGCAWFFHHEGTKLTKRAGGPCAAAVSDAPCSTMKAMPSAAGSPLANKEEFLAIGGLRKDSFIQRGPLPGRCGTRNDIGTSLPPQAGANILSASPSTARGAGSISP
jgi:hypothetical protein